MPGRCSYPYQGGNVKKTPKKSKSISQKQISRDTGTNVKRDGRKTEMDVDQVTAFLRFRGRG